MTLYFFERITDDDFVGPIVIAAPSELEAWGLLARREGQPPDALRDLGWDVAQELSRIPERGGIVYPGTYR